MAETAWAYDAYGPTASSRRWSSHVREKQPLPRWIGHPFAGDLRNPCSLLMSGETAGFRNDRGAPLGCQWLGGPWLATASTPRCSSRRAESRRRLCWSTCESAWSAVRRCSRSASPVRRSPIWTGTKWAGRRCPKSVTSARGHAQERQHHGVPVLSGRALERGEQGDRVDEVRGRVAEITGANSGGSRHQLWSFRERSAAGSTPSPSGTELASPGVSGAPELVENSSGGPPVDRDWTPGLVHRDHPGVPVGRGPSSGRGGGGGGGGAITGRLAWPG